MNIDIATDQCAHRTSYACVVCHCTACMDCDTSTNAEEHKTAVRWCRTCDPYDLGKLGKLDDIEAMKANRTIYIYKAQSFNGRAPQRGLIVQIHTELPQLDEVHWRDSSRAMERNAVELARALRDTLPGGTFDRLVAELLRMKASDLTVSRG